METEVLSEADFVFKDFSEISIEFLGEEDKDALNEIDLSVFKSTSSSKPETAGVTKINNTALHSNKSSKGNSYHTRQAKAANELWAKKFQDRYDAMEDKKWTFFMPESGEFLSF